MFPFNLMHKPVFTPFSLFFTIFILFSMSLTTQMLFFLQYVFKIYSNELILYVVFHQEWGNVCSIYGENSFKMGLSNLDARYMRPLQLFQKLKVEQGSFDFDAFYERLAPIFPKKPQQSSNKVYSQVWPLYLSLFHIYVS